jgi:EAL domain-containing protein (putative c-di-GMP-specific phosphodiesterase class I)
MCPISKDDRVTRGSVQQQPHPASGLVRIDHGKRELLARSTSKRVGSVKAIERALALRAVAQMKRALDTMRMAFQPIVDTRRRRVFAYEALMRNDEASFSLPSDVLNAARKLDCFQDVGRRVRALSAEAFTIAPADALLFVNLHTSDLLDPALYEAGAPLTKIAGRVVLEITEGASLDSVKDIQARLGELRHHGFRIAIDDLGAGYAGLSACVVLEPEFAKLDMFLVRNIHESDTRQRLIETIMSMRTRMRMEIIAEGVEAAAECRQLQAFECRLMQGYLFAKPGPPFPVIEPFDDGNRPSGIIAR